MGSRTIAFGILAFWERFRSAEENREYIFNGGVIEGGCEL